MNISQPSSASKNFYELDGSLTFTQSSASAWQDQTLTGVPAGATAIITMQNVGGTTKSLGVRVKGSGLNRYTPVLNNGTNVMDAVCDGASKIQTYSTDGTGGSTFVVTGYWY